MAQVDEDIVKFQFLCEIPTLDITPALEEEECLVCKEPYQNNGWELGGTLHRPVALRCGHVLGFQCLAVWMLSTNFHNHCSLCRTQIYDPSTTGERLSPALASSFARIAFHSITGENNISRIRKAQLLEIIQRLLRDDRTLSPMAESNDRIMVVWEEFLNNMCNESATPDEGNPAAIRGPRVIVNRLLGSWDQILRYYLEENFVEVFGGLFFYAVGLLVVNMGLVGIELAGDEKTKFKMLISSRDLLIGCIVGAAVSMSQISRGYKIFSGAVVSVLLLRVLVPSAGLFLARGPDVRFEFAYGGLEELLVLWRILKLGS